VNINSLYVIVVRERLIKNISDLGQRFLITDVIYFNANAWFVPAEGPGYKENVILVGAVH
jgi:hypothetical protein